MRRRLRPGDRFSRDLFLQADLIASGRPRRARWRLIRAFALAACLIWCGGLVAILSGRGDLYAISLFLGLIPAAIGVSLATIRRFWIS